jgi:hypothetical protein
VDGLSLAIEETLLTKFDLVGMSCSGSAGSGGPLGPRWAVIADTIAGRTLKFFNCFFKSDLAPFGAFLKGSCQNIITRTHQYILTGKA